jgi:hypothetical protein
MSARIRAHIRSNVVGYVAIFLFAIGGTASAVDGPLPGQNQVGSADIIDGEVKSPDIGGGEVKEADVGPGAVASNEVKNDSIVAGDVAPNSLTSGRIADGTLTGADVANNSLKGADVDESTLEVGDAARAYAVVNPLSCDDLTDVCEVDESKGISSVIREATGFYCVTAPGISAEATPAAVTVDWANTDGPKGNASAMTREALSCGSGTEGFRVVTERLPTSGTILSDAANDVGFTIVIP